MSMITSGDSSRSFMSGRSDIPPDITFPNPALDSSRTASSIDAGAT